MSLQCITGAATTGTLNDELDLFSQGNNTQLMDNIYATASMFSVEVQAVMALSRPVSQDSGEEELYTSFEQAISDRVTALNSKLQRITCSSSPAPVSSSPVPIPAFTKTTSYPFHFPNRWQHLLLSSSLALMFLLIGFDLMGLLVRYLH